MTKKELEPQAKLESQLNYAVSEIKTYYGSLGPIARFFFPKAIKEAIDKESDQKIVEAISRNTGYFQYALFPKLAQFKFAHDPYKSIESRIKEIKKFYDEIGVLRQFFFPGAFKKAINEHANDFEIAAALFAGTRFYHKILYPGKLAGYFSYGATESSRWLFDPNAIAKTKVGQHIENKLASLEDEYTSKNDIEPFTTLEKYLKKHTLVKFFIPRELADLIENKTKEPNRKIRITLAVFNLSWYQKLFLSVFYPSMIKNFKSNPNVNSFHEEIKNQTILPGKERVARNLKTLKEIEENANNAKEKIQFSKTLSYDLANIICSLNRYNSESNNLNAQLTLDLIRLSGESSSDKSAILYICDAITLYFKNYNQTDGNTKLRILVEAFRSDVNYLALYKFCRQDELGLLNDSDTARNRANIDKIKDIQNKDNAKASIEILQRNQLIIKNNTKSQENFDRFFELQKNVSLHDFNEKLIEIEKSLKNLSADFKIEQSLFDTILITGGPTLVLMDRMITLLAKMNQLDEISKKEAYAILLKAITQHSLKGHEALSAYLNELNVSIQSLISHNQFDLNHLKLLLGENVISPVSVKDEILKGSLPGRAVNPAKSEEKQDNPNNNRPPEATTPIDVLGGLGAAFAQFFGFVSPPNVQAQKIQAPPKEPQYVPFYDPTSLKITNPRVVEDRAETKPKAPKKLPQWKSHNHDPRPDNDAARVKYASPIPQQPIVHTDAEYQYMEEGLPLPGVNHSAPVQQIAPRKYKTHQDSTWDIAKKVGYNAARILWSHTGEAAWRGLVEAARHPNEKTETLPVFEEENAIQVNSATLMSPVLYPPPYQQERSNREDSLPRPSSLRSTRGPQISPLATATSSNLSVRNTEAPIRQQRNWELAPYVRVASEYTPGAIYVASLGYATYIDPCVLVSMGFLVLPEAINTALIHAAHYRPQLTDTAVSMIPNYMIQMFYQQQPAAAPLVLQASPRVEELDDEGNPLQIANAETVTEEVRQQEPPAVTWTQYAREAAVIGLFHTVKAANEFSEGNTGYLIDLGVSLLGGIFTYGANQVTALNQRFFSSSTSATTAARHDTNEPGLS